MEFCIFSLIKTDLISLVKIKATLAKNFHIQPSEVDNMQMWEFELFINHLNDLVKDENDSQKAEMDKYKVNDYMKRADPRNIKNMTNFKAPTMPNMNVAAPKLW